MSYKFNNKIHNIEGMYGVDYQSLSQEEKALFEINSYTWTPEVIQELIDNSRSLEIDKELHYQVDHGHLGIIITKNDGVAFFDLNNNEKEGEDFVWSFEKFISFMEDFKKFLLKSK